MDEKHNFKKLKAHILSLSAAHNWEVAKKEWAFTGLYEADEPETCPCGHHPIIEICEIYNKVTKKRTSVGNVCVHRFLGHRSDLIFSAIKKIKKDIQKSLNADAISFLKERDVINDWEYSFLQNTMRKRTLSAAQIRKRVTINNKVLEVIAKRGFRGPS